MSDDKHLDPLLKTALNLDGSTESIKDFYAGWAETYDQKTADWHYAAPSNAIQLMQSIKKDDSLTMDPFDKQLKIMDAGCGTGQVAQKLQQQGYTNIDGFDLSEEMVEIALTLGCYGEVVGGIDINQPIRPQWSKAYDCTICIGVFTPGHVTPQAISQLQAMTRQGGLIIISTRVAYYESEGYQAVSDEMEKAGQIKLLGTLKNAAYTEDSEAHYWAYSVLA